MALLQSGVDIATIALWLGHESIETTHIYLEADLEMKERALKKLAPVDGQGERYIADDPLLMFLNSLISSGLETSQNQRFRIRPGRLEGALVP